MEEGAAAATRREDGFPRLLARCVTLLTDGFQA